MLTCEYHKNAIYMKSYEFLNLATVSPSSCLFIFFFFCNTEHRWAAIC